ncbi:enolase C-terminal domain-like protein [Paenibacillus flagellatus]|uniref:L-alanine-DL-glutamate epimerase n=1 Tax=Paenibacillus flagellatus TaxID=2211139 RepID=A0A2V5JX32_9BACL|nr:enolase C-terminal domain-like protein [Paenibacillus flagellatus]PYI51405.1 L-alanine-DL-glutamate epimerase [Paenibacillus flagellatus]
MIRIEQARWAVEREPLATPFGFKGGYLSELWQTAVRLQGESGRSAVGLGIQSVLWSDPRVFFATDETAGNEIMLGMTKYACRQAEGSSYEEPPELLERLVRPVLDYGRERAGRADLRETFALNALVPLDHAAWLLYAQEKGTGDFDAMVPERFRHALDYRHRVLACTPVVTYNHGEKDVLAMLDEGYFVLKLKLGSDPDKDGDPDKMLEWDKRQLELVHRLASERTTPHTESGKVVYYLDANGRYDTVDRVLRLLDHADRIGALERTILLEEPFPEENKTSVESIPVRVAADESVHGERDAYERMDLGYGAITLKPIAKTMSVTLKVARAARERGVPCFCADLTVNPWMVDWNKNVAARLAPIPGLKVGLIESNGPQNYANWDVMSGRHPYAGAPWTRADNGVFRLEDDFYAESGGSFGRSAHYDGLPFSRD